MLTWTTEKRKITELIPAEYNPRQATEKDKIALETSLERFNLADPLIINRNNRVIGGHFRLSILKEKGMQEIDVRVPNRDLTQDEEIELGLRLNKNTGSFDEDLLAILDKEILTDIGFDENDIESISGAKEENIQGKDMSFEFVLKALKCSECEKQFGYYEGKRKLPENRKLFCSKECCLKSLENLDGIQ